MLRGLFASVGGIVYTTSDARATRSTPGLSDLLVVFPGRRVLLAWESKAGDERYPAADPRRLTADQRTFGSHMARGLTTAFGFGDAAAARAYLTQQRSA